MRSHAESKAGAGTAARVTQGGNGAGHRARGVTEPQETKINTARLPGQTPNSEQTGL